MTWMIARFTVVSPARVPLRRQAQANLETSLLHCSGGECVGLLSELVLGVVQVADGGAVPPGVVRYEEHMTCRMLAGILLRRGACS